MTKEEIEKQRAAVDAMKGTKAAMETVLARVSTLEAALDQAKRDMISVKGLIGTDVLIANGGSSTIRGAAFAQEAIDKINRALGR